MKKFNIFLIQLATWLIVFITFLLLAIFATNVTMFFIGWIVSGGALILLASTFFDKVEECNRKGFNNVFNR